MAVRLTEEQRALVQGSREAIEREVGVYITRHPQVLSRHSRCDLIQQATMLFCSAVAAGRHYLYAIGAVRKGVHYYASRSLRERTTDADVVDGLAGEPEERLDLMASAMTRLPAAERRVLSLRYGLKGGRPHSAREAGKKLRMSHWSVLTLQRRAEDRLALLLRDVIPPRPEP